LAQGTAEDANQSNNPLNPKPSFNIQDSYAPDLYGSDKYANDVLLRGTLPIAPVALIRVPQLIRATVPISTRPQPGGGYTTGLGDINLFDIFLTRAAGLEIGAGPVLTMPTAAHDELGNGKWQAGVGVLAVHPKIAHRLGTFG
jgi:hypothetical protein